ncbi:MAG: DUF362 domain-containing protein, partial [Nanoarchaeota archaeon]|nr:DUF362 domain-containing protein [Nanoarchaeota archaeon]
LPTIKTHGHTKITGSIKNAFGGLITTRRHHSHKIIDEILVDLLKIQKEIHPSIFTITDGTVSGNGAGPRTMKPVTTNLILASDDPVAIDAVSARIMGFNPLKIKFLRLAHDQNLGIADLKQIDIIGDKPPSHNFTTKKSPVVYFDQILRKKYPLMEPLLFHTPIFNLCILASALYHDYVWYPTIGKARIRKFSKTPWGKLFRTYN